jgi:hypothetical protein
MHASRFCRGASTRASLFRDCAAPERSEADVVNDKPLPAVTPQA